MIRKYKPLSQEEYRKIHGDRNPDAHQSCLVCGKDIYGLDAHERYFCIPGQIIRPNAYRVCEEHKDANFTYEDIYGEE